MLFKHLLEKIFFERSKIVIEDIKIENSIHIRNEINLINNLINLILKETIIEIIEKSTNLKVYKNLKVHYNGKKYVLDMVLILPNNYGIYLKIIPNELDIMNNNKLIFDLIKKSKYYFEDENLKINLMDMIIITTTKNFCFSTYDKKYIYDLIFIQMNRGNKVKFNDGFFLEGNNLRTFWYYMKNRFFLNEEISPIKIRDLEYKRTHELKIIEIPFINNFENICIKSLFNLKFIEKLREINILAPEIILHEMNEKTIKMIPLMY